MMQVFKGNDRFHTQIGWLDSQHTFSFGEHQDPARMGFRNLRVINDDRVTAGAGFGTHGHKDMEIVSYVVDGALGHKDSMGTNGTIVPGEIQRMSAGTGVMHSEMNHQKTSTTHFLQIWILPRERGTKPGYAQKAFPSATKRDVLLRLLTGDGNRDGEASDGAVGIGADVDLYASLLSEGKELSASFKRSGHGFVHVVKGRVDVDGTVLEGGDGVALSGQQGARLKGLAAESDVLVFDLA